MKDYKQHCTKTKTTVQVGSHTADKRSTFGFSIKAEGKKSPLVGAGVSMTERFILDPVQSDLNYPADLIAEHYTIDEALANAELISEVFNVLNTTGVTPLELVEQVKVLRAAVVKSNEILRRLSEEGNYPWFLMAENGGEGWGFLTDVLKETEPK